MISTLNKIALVQCYIHHIKDIEVEIQPPKNTMQQFKLESAYLIALEYFNK